MVGGDRSPVRKIAADEQSGGLVRVARSHEVQDGGAGSTDGNGRHHGAVFEGADIGRETGWARVSTLVGRGGLCGIPSIDGWAAGQEGHGQRRASVVGQGAELRVGAVQAADIRERATRIGAEVVPAVRTSVAITAGKIGGQQSINQRAAANSTAAGGTACAGPARLARAMRAVAARGAWSSGAPAS